MTARPAGRPEPAQGSGPRAAARPEAGAWRELGAVFLFCGLDARVELPKKDETYAATQAKPAQWFRFRAR